MQVNSYVNTYVLHHHPIKNVTFTFKIFIESVLKIKLLLSNSIVRQHQMHNVKSSIDKRWHIYMRRLSATLTTHSIQLN